jgi:hypothetical protein
MVQTTTARDGETATTRPEAAEATNARLAVTTARAPRERGTTDPGPVATLEGFPAEAAAAGWAAGGRTADVTTATTGAHAMTIARPGDATVTAPIAQVAIRIVVIARDETRGVFAGRPGVTTGPAVTATTG